MSTSTGEAGFMTEADVRDRYGIDLATAEMLRSGFIEVTRHMHRSLQRSAFSNVAREILDFGVCLHLPQPEGIDLVAVTEGCTHFAFTHPPMTNFVLDEWGMENLGPGDTIVCNDPWRGAIHLPDVNLLRPVFWEGEPLFVLSDATHIVDIGGPVPGGFNNAAEDFFAEGLRIPPMLITSGDVPVRSAINLILENTRTPRHNLGDLRALFGTMRAGETRLRRLLERYGRDRVVAGARYTLDLAERRMSAAIAAVPDGVYEAEEWIDDDGLSEAPIRVKLSGRVSGSDIELDFSGTDAQPLGPLTTCWEELARVLIGAKMLLDPNHPLNSGGLRPFHVLAAPGSVVLGTPPTSNSQHPELATKIASLSLKLFTQMRPELGVAADGGTCGAFICNGIDQREGRQGLPFGFIVQGGLGWGGTSTADGIDFCTTPIFGLSSPTFELMERDGPILLRGLNGAIDSAGAGRFRAGNQNVMLLECTGPMSLSTVLDSSRFTREGADGGGNGMTSYLFRVRKDEGNRIPYVDGVVPLDHLEPLVGRFDRDGVPDPVDGEAGRGAEFKTAKITNMTANAGDVLMVITASGGGFGNPLERETEAVRADVWNEKLSLVAAERLYGVVIDAETLAVDEVETAALRSELAAAFGREDGVPVAIIDPWPRTAEELPPPTPVLAGAVAGEPA
jgi:N-methylhydantoinase B